MITKIQCCFITAIFQSHPWILTKINQFKRKQRNIIRKQKHECVTDKLKLTKRGPQLKQRNKILQNLFNLHEANSHSSDEKKSRLLKKKLFKQLTNLSSYFESNDSNKIIITEFEFKEYPLLEIFSFPCKEFAKYPMQSIFEEGKSGHNLTTNVALPKLYENAWSLTLEEMKGIQHINYPYKTPNAKLPRKAHKSNNNFRWQYRCKKFWIIKKEQNRLSIDHLNFEKKPENNILSKIIQRFDEQNKNKQRAKKFITSRQTNKEAIQENSRANDVSIGDKKAAANKEPGDILDDSAHGHMPCGRGKTQLKNVFFFLICALQLQVAIANGQKIEPPIDILSLIHI